MNWLRWLRNLFSGCLHAHTTFPMSVAGGGPRVVCLDCGREFVYDWDRMEVKP